MQLQLDYLKVTRDNMLKIAGNYTAEELNNIPEGFNNNLIWNLGHVLVTQQLLTYGLSSMPLKVSAELVNKYRKGTRPEGPINQGEIDYISSALMELPELFMEDYEGGQFKSFKQYSTSYGVTLNSVEEAMKFNNLHEAMHLGTVIGLRKFL